MEPLEVIAELVHVRPGYAQLPELLTREMWMNLRMGVVDGLDWALYEIILQETSSGSV